MSVPPRVFPNFSTRRLDEIFGQIRDAGKTTRKAYSYMLTESQGSRNKEVHHFCQSGHGRSGLSSASSLPRCVVLDPVLGGGGSAMGSDWVVGILSSFPY